MTKPVFKLCAVAKDEGPYLAEWIFHHLHFGFDLIHVHINRTSDASVAVLERIQQTHPQVTFEFIDWIDLCDPVVSAKLQTVAYAKELALSRQQGVDWLIFLDIDEFWTPDDFETSVDKFAAFVCSVSPAAPICLLWHCELGQHEPFTPLQRGAGYELSSHLKTLIPLRDVEIKQVRTHFPIFGERVTSVDANGSPMKFKQDQPQLAHGTFVAPKSAYVIHRMYRSETEYLALLLKGRPSRRHRLKLNRPGGYRSHRNVSVRHRFIWPEQAFRAYALKRRLFLHEHDIESLIREDTAAILRKSKQAVPLLRAMLEKPDRDQALAFLKGTQHAVGNNQDTPTPASPRKPLSHQSGRQQPATAIELTPSSAVGQDSEMAAEVAPAVARERVGETPVRQPAENMIARVAEPAAVERAERTKERFSVITAEPSFRESVPLSTSDKAKSRFPIVKVLLFSALVIFVWYAARGPFSFSF